MANILGDDTQQQVLALGRQLRRIGATPWYLHEMICRKAGEQIYG
jgi:hypothetical protein